MTDTETKLLIIKTGLTTAQAARECGVGRSTMFKYASGERPTPKSITFMLKAMGNK